MSLFFFFCKIELAEANINSIIKNATKLQDIYASSANMLIKINQEPIVVDVTTSEIKSYHRARLVLQMCLFGCKKAHLLGKTNNDELLIQISTEERISLLEVIHEDFDVFFSKFFKEVVIWNSVRNLR